MVISQGMKDGAVLDLVTVMTQLVRFVQVRIRFYRAFSRQRQALLISDLVLMHLLASCKCREYQGLHRSCTEDCKYP